MSKPKKSTKREILNIERTVAYYEENFPKFEALAKSILAQINSSENLIKEVHSLKYRVKKPSHLHDKLLRKLLKAKESGTKYDICPENLFEKVTDLAGIRILHLHTLQIKKIHDALLDIFDEQKYKQVEEPTANCWDIEFESMFKEFGITTRSRDSLYTTVHYVIEANQRSQLTCEIQVRTLMDEVWGEVSHIVNYPHESKNTACQDQLKVLARLTSGGVRLVDSIFRTHESDKKK